jgi:hypothetical protein
MPQKPDCTKFFIVIPAKAGIALDLQASRFRQQKSRAGAIPAFAGMTS